MDKHAPRLDLNFRALDFFLYNSAISSTVFRHNGVGKLTNTGYISYYRYYDVLKGDK